MSKEFYDIPETIYSLLDFNEKLPTTFKSSFDYINAENSINKIPHIDFITVNNKIQKTINKINKHLSITVSKYPNNFKKLGEILLNHEEQIDIYKLTIATLNNYANEEDFSKAPDNLKELLQNINNRTSLFLYMLWSDL